jgi:hypothetical protein
MCEAWEEAEQVYDGREVAYATVQDELQHRASEMAESGLEVGLVLAEFPKVDLENAKGLDASEVCEPFESILVLGFVRWRIA